MNNLFTERAYVIMKAYM